MSVDVVSMALDSAPYIHGNIDMGLGDIDPQAYRARHGLYLPCLQMRASRLGNRSGSKDRHSTVRNLLSLGLNAHALAQAARHAPTLTTSVAYRAGRMRTYKLERHVSREMSCKLLVPGCASCHPGCDGL